MNFDSYLKICRENLDFTQKDLVNALYHFDDIFRGLDITAMGRWERGTTKVPLLKQTKILGYFFEKFDYCFPFLEMNDIDTIEQRFSTESIKKLLGKHRQLIMSFPTAQSDNTDFTVMNAKNSIHNDTSFSTTINICKDMYGNAMCYSKEKLKAFSLSPRSLFFICEYKEQYFGHSFFICLKTDIYEKVINFEIDYKDISLDDLALDDEEGCYLSMGLFAMNDKALSLLFIRLYAYLILDQKHISHIGTVISKEDAKEMARNLGLKKYKVKDTHMAYSGMLKDVLLSEQIIKILFSS